MSLKFFKYSEFDSPDVKGSGKHMKHDFMEMLDEAREIAEMHITKILFVGSTKRVLLAVI